MDVMLWLPAAGAEAARLRAWHEGGSAGAWQVLASADGQLLWRGVDGSRCRIAVGAAPCAAQDSSNALPSWLCHPAAVAASGVHCRIEWPAQPAEVVAEGPLALVGADGGPPARWQFEAAR